MSGPSYGDLAAEAAGFIAEDVVGRLHGLLETMGDDGPLIAARIVATALVGFARDAGGNEAAESFAAHVAEVVKGQLDRVRRPSGGGWHERR